jgi:hypothetical protein
MCFRRRRRFLLLYIWWSDEIEHNHDINAVREDEEDNIEQRIFQHKLRQILVDNHLPTNWVRCVIALNQNLPDLNKDDQLEKEWSTQSLTNKNKLEWLVDPSYWLSYGWFYLFANIGIRILYHDTVPIVKSKSILLMNVAIRATRYPAICCCCLFVNRCCCSLIKGAGIRSLNNDVLPKNNLESGGKKMF